MSTCAEGPAAVLIFARAPVPGEAKTRLIPALGAAGAARLQQRLTEHALATAVAAGTGDVQLWCTPDPGHPFFVECARRYPLALRAQSGATLGERLASAAVRELRGREAVVLIGTDCPALTVRHLRDAVHAVRHSTIVIHPAEDGGYTLIALSQHCPEAFTAIDWGSSRVFEQTMARCARAGYRTVVQETLWDVDVPADYERLVRAFPGWVDNEPHPGSVG